MKKEKFISDYSIKLDLQDQVKIQENLTKIQLYYFNVDLKFILKARLFKLKKKFEKNMQNNSRAHGSTYQCDQCDVGRMKEKIYSDVDANGLRFKCPHCKSDLKEVIRDN